MSEGKLNRDANKIFRPQPFKWKRYTAVAVIFFIVAFIVVIFPKSDEEPSFHAEIFPSNAISYINDNELFALNDGDYNLAMPEGGTFVNGIAPMLLVEVDEKYYPLNIADDSILPRQGRQLPLKILFGFPVRDFRRKASYYLHVDNGFGTVQRRYKIVTH